MKLPLKIIWKILTEGIRRVRHLRIASKQSGKEKISVPVLNVRTVAVLT